MMKLSVTSDMTMISDSTCHGCRSKLYDHENSTNSTGPIS
jgi:hypothetical protein